MVPWGQLIFYAGALITLFNQCTNPVDTRSFQPPSYTTFYQADSITGDSAWWEFTPEGIILGAIKMKIRNSGEFMPINHVRGSYYIDYNANEVSFLLSNHVRFKELTIDIYSEFAERNLSDSGLTTLTDSIDYVQLVLAEMGRDTSAAIAQSILESKKFIIYDHFDPMEYEERLSPGYLEWNIYHWSLDSIILRPAEGSVTTQPSFEADGWEGYSLTDARHQAYKDDDGSWKKLGE